jgi:Spy/CpxP family protein refolding chaperone
MKLLHKSSAIKTFRRLAALCLLLSLAAFSFSENVRAQEPSAAPPETEDAAPRPARQRRRAERALLARLSLTPEQRARLREIRRQSEPEARALTRRLNQARRALDEAVYSDETNEATVGQRARELSDVQAAVVRLRALTELRVRRVLTPEQLQTFRALRREALRQRLLQRRQAAPARNRLQRP